MDTKLAKLMSIFIILSIYILPMKDWNANSPSWINGLEAIKFRSKLSNFWHEEYVQELFVVQMNPKHEPDIW